MTIWLKLHLNIPYKFIRLILIEKKNFSDCNWLTDLRHTCIENISLQIKVNFTFLNYELSFIFWRLGKKYHSRIPL